MFLGKCSYTQYLYGRSPDLKIVVTRKYTDFSVCLFGTHLFVNFSHLTISNLFELIQVLFILVNKRKKYIKKNITVAVGIDFACYTLSLCTCMSLLLLFIISEILGKYKC